MVKRKALYLFLIHNIVTLVTTKFLQCPYKQKWVSIQDILTPMPGPLLPMPPLYCFYLARQQ